MSTTTRLSQITPGVDYSATFDRQVTSVRDDINTLTDQLQHVQQRDKRFESEMSGVNYLIQKMRSRISGLSQKLDQMALRQGTSGVGGAVVSQSDANALYDLKQEISKLKINSTRVVNQGSVVYTYLYQRDNFVQRQNCYPVQEI